jgi:NitT/TauT family transport system permease protein
VSIGAPIPGVAYAPLFMLWFGLGNFSAVLLVVLSPPSRSSSNTWTGRRSRKSGVLAQVMGATAKNSSAM